jgi:hypothetical protein
MRAYRASLLLSAIVIVLGSCATSTFRVAGVPTFGRIQDVSVVDIEAAVSAFKAATRPGASVGEIEVVSHDEIRIYQDAERRNYTSMVRTKGKWQVGSVVLVHPVY